MIQAPPTMTKNPFTFTNGVGFISCYVSFFLPLSLSLSLSLTHCLSLILVLYMYVRIFYFPCIDCFLSLPHSCFLSFHMYVNMCLLAVLSSRIVASLPVFFFVIFMFKRNRNIDKWNKVTPIYFSGKTKWMNRWVLINLLHKLTYLSSA